MCDTDVEILRSVRCHPIRFARHIRVVGADAQHRSERARETVLAHVVESVAIAIHGKQNIRTVIHREELTDVVAGRGRVRVGTKRLVDAVIIIGIVA